MFANKHAWSPLLILSMGKLLLLVVKKLIFYVFFFFLTMEAKEAWQADGNSILRFNTISYSGWQSNWGHSSCDSLFPNLWLRQVYSCASQFNWTSVAYRIYIGFNVVFSASREVLKCVLKKTRCSRSWGLTQAARIMSFVQRALHFL